MAISILPPSLTIEQQAKLKRLNGMLSIKDIASLRYPEDKVLSKAYAFEIAEACLQGELDYIHPIRNMTWQWLCDNPGLSGFSSIRVINCNEDAFYPGSPEYNDNESPFLLEHEWKGEPEPRPAYKYNDTLSRLKRFNFFNKDAFDIARYDYATHGRCLISCKVFKQWLITKDDYPLPDGCLLDNWFPLAGVDKPAPAVPVVVGSDKPRRTRKDKLALAIQAAIKIHPNKTANELFDYLHNNDETGAIVDSTNDKLVWEDNRGNCHDKCQRLTGVEDCPRLHVI